ncbi:hypothetical protein MKW98_031527 [Papaver atlanticum]|uniref:Uncharacterized protein n=1 Tax=Papaver atlanticum TaxID=357466 RepID=A0AAD4S5J4_9MAGN|nr:hypothetical protein MKW98_031527 [Papaver atlanticum]
MEKMIEAEMDELFDSFGRIMHVFKSLPVAKEESDKQEKEEDASSTSSIDYYYSEEEGDGEEIASTTDVEPVPASELFHYCYGGYGVILRDSASKPITGSAKFAADGKSFFTQVLMGVKAGVRLAKKRGLSNFHVWCNSNKLSELIACVWNCRTPECRSTVDPKGYICNDGRADFTWSDGCDMSLVPLLREIRAQTCHGKDLENLEDFSRSLNGAAYYLEKNG